MVKTEMERITCTTSVPTDLAKEQVWYGPFNLILNAGFSGRLHPGHFEAAQTHDLCLDSLQDKINKRITMSTLKEAVAEEVLVEANLREVRRI